MIVANQNAPKVRFVRINGRIIPIVSGKKSPKAEKALNRGIDEMTSEVSVAEAGRRTVNDHGERVTWGSSFPKYFGENGFRTKKQWMSAVEKKSGKDYEVITKMAADTHAFRIATKQIFDNHNVIFRNIDGRVRPIKLKSREQFEFYNWKPTKKNGVPF